MQEAPKPRYALRLAALSFGMLLPSLGTSIANVALPSLKLAFGAGSQDVQWVVIAYLMSITALLVTAGRLGDLFGKRRLLLAGMGLFALAALLAALAPALWIVILARGLQGIGAAAMMSLTVAAVGDMVPKDRAGSAIGLLGTVSAVGTAIGPSLGGVLIAYFGWHAVFALMALAGAAALAFAWPLLPRDTPTRTLPVSFDIPGTIVLTLAIAAFALATTLAPMGLLNAALLGLFMIALATFIFIEKRSQAPLLQLRLLKSHGLSAGLVSLGLVSTILMTTLVVGPLYLSSVLGLGPATTGLVMSIGPVVAALVGYPAGLLVDRFGHAAASSVGLAGVLAGTLLMSFLPPILGVPGYAGSLVVITAAYAVFLAANNTGIMTGAGKEQRGVVSALLSLARNLGLIAGASAMGSVFALGSAGLAPLHLAQGGETGLRVTFLLAAILASIALVTTLWSRWSASRSPEVGRQAGVP